MILVDTSQIVFAAMFATDELKGAGKIELPLFRHIVLNILRSQKTKFGSKYGDIVLCYDASNNWRKKHFPYYKANRSIDREKDSSIDWSAVFQMFGELRKEFQEALPYKQVWVDTAEGDDVIAVLSKRHDQTEDGSLFGLTSKNLIISSDGDFKQLQNQNVDQWNPILKKFVTESDPDRFLAEKILRGDKGDGVPNILSDDDVFVRETKRQKPMTEKRLNVLIDKNSQFVVSELNENDFKNLQRNQLMIDLSKIPEPLVKEINATYDSFVVPTRNKLYNYFIQHRITGLLDVITEF